MWALAHVPDADGAAAIVIRRSRIVLLRSLRGEWADPVLRRVLNQAFFPRVEVEVDGMTCAHVRQPFSDVRHGHIVDRIKRASTALVRPIRHRTLAATG